MLQTLERFPQFQCGVISPWLPFMHEVVYSVRGLHPFTSGYLPSLLPWQWGGVPVRRLGGTWLRRQICVAYPERGTPGLSRLRHMTWSCNNPTGISPCNA